MIPYKQRLITRFFVRFHMSLILAAVIASGVSVSKLLLEIGLADVRVRYPVAVLISYGVFLLLVRIWIWYVTPGRSSVPDGDLLLDLADVVPLDLASSGGGAEASSLVPSSSSRGGSWLPDFDLDDGAVWILIVLAILIAAIFGVGVYLIYIAPELLPEAALQLALASGLIRVSRVEDRGGWLGGVLRSTWIPFIVVFGITLLLGLVVHGSCPQATRLADALRCPDTQLR